MKLIALLIYLPLQIAFIPLAIIGLVLTGYKQLAVSKRLGLSQTAIEIINGRWTMHIFGIREDAATDELISVLPNTSTFGLWLVLFPLWLQTRLSGQLSFYPRVPAAGEEKISDMVPARTLYFDQIINRVLKNVDQFVLLGAGYDTRAYGLFSDSGVTFFELDQAVVQSHKREMLNKTSINTDHVNFVTVDFSQDNLLTKLAEAGFDDSKKTLFLWEGVTLYLSRADVERTMKLVKQHSPTGSILLADIYAERMIKFLGKANAGEKLLELTGEGFNFGLPMDADWEKVLQEFIEDQSLTVGESHFLGSNDKAGPYAVVLEMQC